MGRVGELVRASVTTKLCPSQPLVDSLSGDLLVGAYGFPRSRMEYAR